MVNYASPAAFGRLCVETIGRRRRRKGRGNQPPSGGCVLKPHWVPIRGISSAQPPSGGCVLKPLIDANDFEVEAPAAFGRLCVETM